MADGVIKQLITGGGTSLQDPKTEKNRKKRQRLRSSTSTDPSWLEPRCHGTSTVDRYVDQHGYGYGEHQKWSKWLRNGWYMADKWLVLMQVCSQIYPNMLHRFWMRIPRIQNGLINMFHFEHDKKLPTSSSSNKHHLTVELWSLFWNGYSGDICPPAKNVTHVAHVLFYLFFLAQETTDQSTMTLMSSRKGKL